MTTTITDRLCGACGQHHGPALTDCDLFGPEDWAVISDAVMHTLGVLPDDGQGCYACDLAGDALVQAYTEVIERAVDGRW